MTTTKTTTNFGGYAISDMRDGRAKVTRDGAVIGTYDSREAAEAHLRPIVEAEQAERQAEARQRMEAHNRLVRGDKPTRHVYEGTWTSQYGPNIEHGTAYWADGLSVGYTWGQDGRRDYNYDV